MTRKEGRRKKRENKIKHMKIEKNEKKKTKLYYIKNYFQNGFFFYLR